MSHNLLNVKVGDRLVTSNQRRGDARGMEDIYVVKVGRKYVHTVSAGAWDRDGGDIAKLTSSHMTTQWTRDNGFTSGNGAGHAAYTPGSYEAMKVREGAVQRLVAVINDKLASGMNTAYASTFAGRGISDEVMTELADDLTATIEAHLRKVKP